MELIEKEELIYLYEDVHDLLVAQLNESILTVLNRDEEYVFFSVDNQYAQYVVKLLGSAGYNTISSKPDDLENSLIAFSIE
ncbi:hypothetical protein LD13_gp034 [Bacillus phage Bobb]|uniref:Uncharacterized protein n=1 Tax=Bacillus phage Bobb TaxID=1527469 RepID=A0A076GD70_9CAUD|nr:hypothetical protein LD13_gp034 [Bacillus phage Bobb]AII27935.1 hypothetical protein [Bacillus phage Bobb]